MHSKTSTKHTSLTSLPTVDQSRQNFSTLHWTKNRRHTRCRLPTQKSLFPWILRVSIVVSRSVKARRISAAVIKARQLALSHTNSGQELLPREPSSSTRCFMKSKAMACSSMPSKACSHSSLHPTGTLLTSKHQMLLFP